MVSQLQATFYCHLIQIFIEVARAKSLTNEGSHYETDHQFDNSADDLRELKGGKGGGKGSFGSSLKQSEEEEGGEGEKTYIADETDLSQTWIFGGIVLAILILAIVIFCICKRIVKKVDGNVD